MGALNDIKYKAPHTKTGNHKNEHIKTIGLTNSGYCLVWEGNELITVFKPGIGGKNYFNKWKIDGKVIDIDTGEKIERVKKWYEIF